MDGVCITGGEPTLMPGLGDLIAGIKDLGYSVKLDTNGTRPDVLKALLDRNLLDYVAMDIKNSCDSYGAACGVNFDVGKIKRSVEIIKSSGVDREFRTTVVKGIHTAADIAQCAAWVGEGEKYFLQSYKESDDIIAPDGLSAFSNEELREMLEEAKKYNSVTELRGVE